MRKLSIIFISFVLVLLTSCQPKPKVGTAYLSLEFTDTLTEFLSCWVYDHECVLSIVPPTSIDDRTALLVVDSVVDFADVDVWTIYTHAGVRIVPGDTIHLQFAPSSESPYYPDSVRQMYPDHLAEGYYATTCLNPVPENDIVDAIIKAFNGGDMLRHAILADAHVDDSLYLRALPEVEQRFADIKTQYDKRLNKQLTALADMRRAYMLSNMRYNVAKEQGISEDEVPGTDWYYSFIQPNNLAHAKMGYSGDWIEHEALKVVPDGAQPQLSNAILNLADSILTNPAKAEWLDNWTQSSLFGIHPVSVNELPSLWERYKQVAADCPEVLAKWQEQYDKTMALAPGKPVNDVTMQTPDGTEVQLSSIFGKLLYIDVWATWCGPCCAEIPYIEKLVNQFKGNDKVAFASISTDSTDEPWLKKLASDRPAWAQYRLNSERKKQFCDDWDIPTIPRFIMIAPDGTICDANAPRPSSPGTAAYIEECIKKYE